MFLTQSIFEAASLRWFRELSYWVMPGPHLAPGERAAERHSYGEVGEFRLVQTLSPAISKREKEEDSEAIRRLNLAIPEEAAVTDKASLSDQTTAKGG